MDWYLTQWGETLTRYRATVTYDAKRVGTETWGSSLSFTGDFQPLSGDEIAAEAGLEVKSDGKIQTEYDVDVIAHDRVVRDGITYGVTYCRIFEDHQNIFVAKEVQQ